VIAASLLDSIGAIIEAIFRGFTNVAFTGSLIVTGLMAAGVLWYAKRRPVGTPLTWGEAMASATYVTFALFWAFAVVPHQWLTYAEGELAMRSDAILAGPGSTGLMEWSPIVITKQTLSDLIAVHLYLIAFVLSVWLWAKWQNRGKDDNTSVETSAYGRPIVKA
jgi:hypothetical protein